MSYFRIGGSSGGGSPIDNISATKVIETSTRVFVTPQEKAQITDNKQRIETLEQSGGGIDLTQIVDGVTIALVDDKLVVKNVEGLVIGIVDINNWLSGTERNIQDQIDDINTSLVALTSGMRFRGKVATRADLSTVTSTENGDLVVVLADEQQNDGRSLYVFSDDLNEWDFIGEFIFSDKFIELQDTPNSYVGHDGKIVRVDETNEKLVFDVIHWSEIEGKPNSTPTQIDNAVSKAHEHANKTVLDKFSEDAEGKPLYDGKSIGNGESADLSELEQKVNNNTTAITNLEEDFDRHLAESVTDIDGVHGLNIEEGTWTPSLIGSSGTSNQTYSKRVGKYYKIGKKVFVSGAIALSSKDELMSGFVGIEGLPFIISNNGAGSIGSVGNIDMLDFLQLCIWTLPSYNSLVLIRTTTNARDSNVFADNLKDNFYIEFSAEYITN